MSPALEILEQRKQAGLFGLFGRTAMPSGVADTDFGRTEWLRAHASQRPPAAPHVGEGFNLPARMAPEPFPKHVLEAKAQSVARSKQVQNVMQAVGNVPRPAAPEASQASRDAQHNDAMKLVRDVEASRQRPKLPLPPPGPAKVACASCPALEVLRLRAAA